MTFSLKTSSCDFFFYRSWLLHMLSRFNSLMRCGMSTWGGQTAENRSVQIKKASVCWFIYIRIRATTVKKFKLTLLRQFLLNLEPSCCQDLYQKVFARIFRLFSTRYLCAVVARRYPNQNVVMFVGCHSDLIKTTPSRSWQRKSSGFISVELLINKTLPCLLQGSCIYWPKYNKNK